MTKRIDHAAEAASDIGFADEVIENGGDSDVAMAIAAVAQVHATLALVEQQRIANLIALDKLWPMPDGAQIAHLIHDPKTFALCADIREGLGL